LVDPRTSIIDKRLKSIRNIIAVSGGKGGVGKSITASALALLLAKNKNKVGLFDLDFTSPSTNLILGIKDAKIVEDKGIIPAKVHGLRYMSIVYYSGDYTVPLRGADISNALIELLAITRWGNLDYLILDTPPGISDATLDLIRLIKEIRFLIITTPSQLAFETVRKLSNLLKTQNIPIIGIIENMKIDNSQTIKSQTQKLGLKYLGQISYDSQIENAIGNPTSLLNTKLAQKIGQITQIERSQTTTCLLNRRD
jgi:ATP-binding protein involved in chromosome partitioning